MKTLRIAAALWVLVTVLCLPLAAQAQAIDSLQIAVPSLNMPADQQLELARAIYQQIAAQGITAATLVLTDDSGTQASFDTTTLTAP